MEFLPTTLGTRPRLAVEVRAEGVVAARAEDASGVLTAVARAELGHAALAPGLKAGNVVDRTLVSGAIRSALDAVVKGSDRSRDVTLVVPDAAVRVLLLEFEQLPSKLAEALPVVRFRLKKLLPFEADDAMVSYQVMASAKGSVQVMAVAIPREVLAEYEAVVVSAGYLPGAVLSSTLAALAGLDEMETAALLVNASEGNVTTAIVKGGVLLLHRALELSPESSPLVHAEVAEAHADSLIDAAVASGGETDRFDAEAAMQTAVLEREMPSAAREIAQAVSVAAAYFEDTLEASPELLLAAGTLGAEALAEMLRENELEGLRVRELMQAEMMAAGAVTGKVARGWLAGVRGALKN